MTRETILNLAHWPARLTSDETASVLGFAGHDITILMKEKLLKPLGSPAPNATKFFSAVEMEALAKDREWLSKATKAVSKHWQSKNQKRCADSALTAA
jgi:hypothetical protein